MNLHESDFSVYFEKKVKTNDSERVKKQGIGMACNLVMFVCFETLKGSECSFICLCFIMLRYAMQ